MFGGQQTAIFQPVAFDEAGPRKNRPDISFCPREPELDSDEPPDHVSATLLVQIAWLSVVVEKAMDEVVPLILDPFEVANVRLRYAVALEDLDQRSERGALQVSLLSQGPPPPVLVRPKHLLQLDPVAHVHRRDQHVLELSHRQIGARHFLTVEEAGDIKVGHPFDEFAELGLR